MVYLNGTLLFAAGVGTLQAHNRWTWKWPLALTLAGWAMVVGGLYRMIAPAGQRPDRGRGPT